MVSLYTKEVEASSVSANAVVTCLLCKQVIKDGKLAKHLREAHELKEKDLVGMAIDGLYSLDIPEVPKAVREIVRDREVEVRMGATVVGKEPKPWSKRAEWR